MNLYVLYPAELTTPKDRMGLEPMTTRLEAWK